MMGAISFEEIGTKTFEVFDLNSFEEFRPFSLKENGAARAVRIGVLMLHLVA